MTNIDIKFSKNQFINNNVNSFSKEIEEIINILRYKKNKHNVINIDNNFIEKSKDDSEEDLEDEFEEDSEDEFEEDSEDEFEEDYSKIKYVNLSKNKSGNFYYDEIFGCDLRYSNVLSCKINNTKVSNLSYRGILIHVLKNMDRKIMLEQFSFNYSLKNMKNVGGYAWCNDLKISFQGKSSQETLKEIIRLVCINNWTFTIKIKQNNENIICFDND